MRRYLLRRGVLAIFQMVVLAVIIFAVTEMLPGDAATVRMAEGVSPSQLAEARAVLELDKPAPVRFQEWFLGLTQGDLGTSSSSGGPVSEILLDSLGPTLVLAVTTTVLLIPLCTVLGFLCGVREGSRLDRVLSTITVALHAIPDFALALLLVALLALQWQVLPATAVGADGEDLMSRPDLLILPVFVLLCRVTSMVSRQVRAGTIAVLHSPYVHQARRLGVPEQRLITRHVAPNALAPAVQSLARVGDGLLGGVLVVEAVFGIPGVATALLDAVSARDVPTVQGLTMVLGASTLLINLGADLIAHRLVPRHGQV